MQDRQGKSSAVWCDGGGENTDRGRPWEEENLENFFVVVSGAT